jgi:hypothetical protein
MKEGKETNYGSPNGKQRTELDRPIQHVLLFKPVLVVSQVQTITRVIYGGNIELGRIPMHACEI